jgi:hypothetical protein
LARSRRIRHRRARKFFCQDEAMAIPKPDYTPEDFPIFYRFGWGGADCPEFSQARREACRLPFGDSAKESRSS